MDRTWSFTTDIKNKWFVDPTLYAEFLGCSAVVSNEVISSMFTYFCRCCLLLKGVFTKRVLLVLVKLYDIYLIHCIAAKPLLSQEWFQRLYMFYDSHAFIF